MKNKIKTFVKDIFALIITIFLFGTLFIFGYSAITKVPIKLEWIIYIKTGIILIIIVIVDLIRNKHN